MKHSVINKNAGLIVLVKQAGLEKTFERFPEDVSVAFDTVIKLRTTGQLLCDPLTEFWPPMRAKE
ncbi:MAG: hypothetical protein RLZZ481_527 [Pseudomonadota bacterium]|jgi:hypothetical protein